LHGDSAGKNVSKYIIFPDSFTVQGVLNMDLTIWLHRARPPSRYNSMYIKIKIAKLNINDIQCGDKTIQQWKSPYSFVWGIILLHELLTKFD
jgi:hypothetical protein